MATIQVPDPDQPWKVGDLVTVHLRVGGANANDYVLEAADVIRRDYVERIHADYHRQLEEQAAAAAKRVESLVQAHDEFVAQLQTTHAADLTARDKTIEQLQVALAKPVGGPVITSAGVT